MCNRSALRSSTKSILVESVFRAGDGSEKASTEKQIPIFLKQAEAGMAVKELCRRHGFSDVSSTPDGPSLAA